MTTYQVSYGSEDNGIACYGNDYLSYTYIIRIDGEEIAEVDGEENYADALEIFNEAYHKHFFADYPSLDEMFSQIPA